MPPVLLAAASAFSLIFRYDSGIGSFYLPSAVAIILLCWWGPARVIPAAYINAVIFTPLWGVVEVWQWFIYPIPEALFIILFWLLFLHWRKGKYWLPDTTQVLTFLGLGMILPLAVDLLLLQGLLTWLGGRPLDVFWTHFSRNWLGDGTANFGITTLVLYWFTGPMHRLGLTQLDPQAELPAVRSLRARNRVMALLIYAILFAFSYVVSFGQYWYVYGLVSLYVAIRFGFGETLICNFYIFTITYLLPEITFDKGAALLNPDSGLVNVFVGNLLLSGFAAVTGRVVSDLRLTEKRLTQKNQQLDQANQELDRFVYSVSHDLSAPLKSIQGLINISKLDQSISHRAEYLEKMEVSVSRLDAFIKEILDYSRNSRLEVVPAPVSVRKVLDEVVENLRYADNFQKTELSISVDPNLYALADTTRLRIIFHNLLSNAFKFQRPDEPHPAVSVSAEAEGGYLHVRIEDNGEGMSPESLTRLFTMFFRASENSTGSGLGLYIAREAAHKIQGSISVTSQLQKGTVFVVRLPQA